MTEIALALMSTYTTVQIGLYEYPHMIAQRSLASKNASRELMLTIAQLLEMNHVSLHDLSYLAASQGPGPFTTLRTVIASINGLAFATHIPLVGVDALSVLVQEYHDDRYACTVALLNAFGGDLYYAVRKTHEARTVSGYQNAQELLQTLAVHNPVGTIQFVGGGVALVTQEIQEQFGARAVIPQPLPEYCSFEKLIAHAHASWRDRTNLVHELFPLYLKSTYYLKNA